VVNTMKTLKTMMQLTKIEAKMGNLRKKTRNQNKKRIVIAVQAVLNERSQRMNKKRWMKMKCSLVTKVWSVTVMVIIP